MFQVSTPINASCEHSHDMNEKEYLSAVYRGHMMTAAEMKLEEGYPQLHAEVLQSMRCVSYFYEGLRLHSATLVQL
jgi:hypothetical protein